MRTFTLLRTKANATNDTAPNSSEPPSGEVYTLARGGTLLFMTEDTAGTLTSANATVYEKVTLADATTHWIAYAAIAITGQFIMYANDDLGPGSQIWIGFDTIVGATAFKVHVVEPGTI